MQKLKSLPAPISVFRKRFQVGRVGDLGVFMKGNDDQSIAPTADKFMWFALEHPGVDHFEHMIGNVAEWVLNKPDVWNVSSADVLKKTDYRQSLVDNWPNLAIMGNSALGAPDKDVKTPVRPNRPLPNTFDDLMGYADVGMRVAFQSARQSTKQRIINLVNALGDQGYLVSKSSSKRKD